MTEIKTTSMKTMNGIIIFQVKRKLNFCLFFIHLNLGLKERDVQSSRTSRFSFWASTFSISLYMQVIRQLNCNTNRLELAQDKHYVSAAGQKSRIQAGVQIFFWALQINSTGITFWPGVTVRVNSWRTLGSLKSTLHDSVRANTINNQYQNKHLWHLYNCNSWNIPLHF